MSLSRAKLEGLVKDLLERTKQPCHQCLKDAGGWWVSCLARVRKPVTHSTKCTSAMEWVAAAGAPVGGWVG